MISTNRSYRKNKIRNAGRFAMAATAGAAGLITATSVAHADPNSPYNWINSNSGNFSDPTSWSNGISPAGDFGTVLNFGASGTYTAVLDVPAGGGQFDVNQVNFNSSPGSTATIGVGTSLTALTFGGNGPSVSLNGGSGTIATPILFNSGSAQLTNYGAGTLTLNSLNISNGSSATINNIGAGTVTLNDAVADYGTNVMLSLGNYGTGLFQIGNIGTVSGLPGSGLIGTLNIVAGPVTFAGNTGGDLFTNGLILNVAAGASFNFANNPEGMGGISGAGNIILGTAGISFVEPGDRTYTGSISGTGAVTQNVANVLYLGGANVYSGTTTIESGGTIAATAPYALSPNSVINLVYNAGTLNLGGFNQSIGGLSAGNGFMLAVASGTTLTVSPLTGVTNSYFGGLSGAGNLVVSGTGTQVIYGNYGITGTTSISSGTLRTYYAGLAGGSGIQIGSTGTLDVIAPTNVTSTLQLAGTGTLSKSGPGVLTFNASNANLNLSAVSINSGGIVSDLRAGNGSQLGSAPTLNMGTGSFALIGNGSAASVQAFGGLTLNGGAELDVTAGTGQTAAVSVGAITRLQGSGATININPVNTGASITTTTTNTAGQNTLGGFATYNGTSWAVAGAGGVIGALPATSYNTGTSSFSTSTLFHADVIANLSVAANSNAYDLRFNTATSTTVTLSGINTLADGGILVTPNMSSKTATISGGTSLTAAANQDIIINQFDTAGTLTIGAVISNTTGSATTLSVANLSSSTTITVPSTTGLFLGESLSAGSNIPLTANAHIVAINPLASTVTISDSVAPLAGTNVSVVFQPGTNLVKSGPGTVILSKNNTFTGVVDLNGGTFNASSSVLNLGSNSASGSTAIVFNGGTLYAAVSETTGSAIQPWIIGPAGANLNVGSSATVSKYGNSIFGSGPITMTSPGAGIFTVGSDGSNFSGSVTINSGIFRFTSNQFQSANGVTIGNGGQYQIDDNGVGTFNFAAGTTLTLNGNGPSGYTYPGAMAETVQSGTSGPVSTFPNPILLASNSLIGVYSTAAYPAATILTGNISGTGMLTVAGTVTNNNSGGTLAVSGNNTFTGGTNISSGTLIAANNTGSATGTGPVTVSSGGTLAGTGFITGVVTVTPGGTIYAGQVNNPAGGNKSAATLTIGTGSMLQGTTLLDLTAAPVAPATVGSSDQIVFGSVATPGVASLGGSLTITNPNNVTFADGETFDLFTFGSNPGLSNFAAVNTPALPTGLIWNLNNLPINGSITTVQNLTFNNSGGSGDGTSFDTTSQNFYNGANTTNFNPGDFVTFDDTTPNNQYTVTINSQIAPGSVTVNNSAGNYTFIGTGGITGPTGLVKMGTGTLTIATADTYIGETDVNGGALVLTATGKIAGNLVVNTGGTFNASANTPGAGILVRTMGTITVNGGGVAAIAPTGAHSDRTVLVTTGVNVVTTAGASGQLDLSNNDMDITNAGTSTLAAVTQLVSSGYNLTSGGNWAGPGITSSTAAANSTHLTALGVIANNVNGVAIYGSTSALGVFDGLSPSPSDVLVKYTYFGDANLDGRVDGSDYSLIDGGYASKGALTGWYNGDFNYDGSIDGSDYALIDNAYNNQGSDLTTPAALVATATDQVAGAPAAAVPEPASLGLIAVAMGGLTARRRRR